MSILRPRLQSVFESTLTVVENGSGQLKGVIADIAQGTVPGNVFTEPRTILRTTLPTALRAGMVLQTRGGTIYIVGENGPEEYGDWTVFQSWRLFPATRRVLWRRSTTTTDVLTQLQESGPPEDMGYIHVLIEPIDRTTLDRKTHVNFEERRFVSGSPVKAGDLLEDRLVSRVDVEQGVYVGVLV